MPACWAVAMRMGADGALPGPVRMPDAPLRCAHGPGHGAGPRGGRAARVCGPSGRAPGRDLDAPRGGGSVVCG